MRHSLGIGMPKPGEAKQGFDHMGETLTGRHLHTDTGDTVTGIPPVMPCIGRDSSGLALAKNARLSAMLHGQFTFENSEAFDQSGVAVFTDDPRSDKSQQFGDRAMLGVLVGKLKN